MSTAPEGPVVVMTMFEGIVGAGVIVPEIVMFAVPVYEDAFVPIVIVAPAAEAATGPRTRNAAKMAVAIVVVVFISITR